MLLAIDAGNTNITFALYDKNAQKAVWRIRTENGRTADEYQAWLYPLFLNAGLSFKDIKEAIISSVVPSENRQLTKLCKTVFKTEPSIINSDSDLGIVINLKKLEEVGADRLVNAIAVLKHYKTPAVVIDFGTATTFDVINDKGEYCGGVIAPGVNLSVKALHDAAAKLPKVTIENPGNVIGNDTVSAMQSGLYWGYVSMIEGVLTRIEGEVGIKPYVIATGGLAGLFAQDNDFIDTVDEDLTLKGLIQIHGNKAT